MRARERERDKREQEQEQAPLSKFQEEEEKLCSQLFLLRRFLSETFAPLSSSPLPLAMQKGAQLTAPAGTAAPQKQQQQQKQQVRSAKDRDRKRRKLQGFQKKKNLGEASGRNRLGVLFFFLVPTTDTPPTPPRHTTKQHRK